MSMRYFSTTERLQDIRGKHILSACSIIAFKCNLTFYIKQVFLTFLRLYQNPSGNVVNPVDLFSE